MSSPNGSLAFATGSMESEWGYNVVGSLALPLSEGFGLQVDGLYTHVSNEDFSGGGLHLFWRDSDKWLVGLRAGGIHQRFVSGLHGGVEAEYYLGRFTFGLEAGAAGVEYDRPVPFIETRPTDFIGTATVSFYPLDDMLVQAAYSRLLGNNLYELLVEYQTPLPGLDCLVQLATGDNDYDHALFGLRYHFGRKKTLMQRHREDHLPNMAKRVLSAIGTYGAEYNRAGRKYAIEKGLGEWGGSSGVERSRVKDSIGSGTLPPIPPVPALPPLPPPPGP